MKKTYILEELDCAHCASLIEEAVGKLEGVVESKVTFLTQKLVIEVEESREKTVFNEIIKVVKKFEPDVEVVEKK